MLPWKRALRQVLMIDAQQCICETHLSQDYRKHYNIPIESKTETLSVSAQVSSSKAEQA